MKLYISEGAVWILLVFYTPLVLLALWFLWSKLPKRLLVRLGILPFAVFVAAAIPLWDVVTTSAKMAELCPEAGIKINRAVITDGFYTNLGGSSDLKRGFKYVEAARPGNRIIIYSKVGDQVQIQELDTEKTPYVLKSRYEIIFDVENGEFEGRRDVGIQNSVARDRETKEELGYARRYFAYPGWVDRNTIALFGRIQWMCPAEPAQDVRFMRQVILPSN